MTSFLWNTVAIAGKRGVWVLPSHFPNPVATLGTSSQAETLFNIVLPVLSCLTTDLNKYLLQTSLQGNFSCGNDKLRRPPASD
jgi:hypothetical protein